MVIIAGSAVVEGHIAALESVKKGYNSYDNHHEGERYDEKSLNSLGNAKYQGLRYFIPPSNLKKEQQATTCNKN